MNYINKLLMLLLLISPITGCSYVSDYVEGQITNRASFSITAEISGNNVILNWDETDSSEDFAGIEIYRSSYENDEYAPYEMIAYRWSEGSGTHGSLNNHSIKQYTDILGSMDPGVYFYRVGFIHWDDSLEEREKLDSGYSGSNPVYDPVTYNNKTSINKTSGYAKVYIP